MDEDLLKALDKDDEVRRLGRSAVLRRITAEYREHQRQNEIADQYKQAYKSGIDVLGEEFSGWVNEGLKYDSAVNLDHVQTVDKSRLHRYIGSI
ncbi:MAG: hypothetical protein DRP87_03580 [Spirochaetes bacterium]|nr:MAG: hypothetical protein DRP87_03580 [Spirochaetota bacterium]